MDPKYSWIIRRTIFFKFTVIKRKGVVTCKNIQPLGFSIKF